jgi:alanine racemase
MRGEAKFVGRPVWAEVSLGALAHNLKAIHRRIGRRRKVLAIVKGNAYGHGAVPVSKALERAGADVFGVTCTSEGIELREAGIRRPILILTGVWVGEEKRLARYRLTPAIARVEQLRDLERAARAARRPIAFHLKVDTGMSRLGITPDEIREFVRALADCPHLRLEGTFTHLASSEDFVNGQTEEQERVFSRVLEGLRVAGVSPGVVHMANSAAIAMRPSTWCDMVRPGALLYGYHQHYNPPERLAEAEAVLALRPIASLRTRIVTLREVSAGTKVGYNARFVTTRPSRIAVIAAGYADGLLRHLTNRGFVLVRGRRAPLIGTISMDLTMVDVTDLPGAALGDVATIYGTDGKAVLPASEVAHWAGTVSSDLLTALGHRVPRFYHS